MCFVNPCHAITRTNACHRLPQPKPGRLTHIVSTNSAGTSLSIPLSGQCTSTPNAMYLVQRSLFLSRKRSTAIWKTQDVLMVCPCENQTTQSMHLMPTTPSPNIIRITSAHQKVHVREPSPAVSAVHGADRCGDWLPRFKGCSDAATIPTRAVG